MEDFSVKQQTKMKGLEQQLNQLEILLENKEAPPPISLWDMDLTDKEKLSIDDSFYEIMGKQLQELKSALKTYVQTSVGTNVSEQMQKQEIVTSSTVMQQYMGGVLAKISEQIQSENEIKERVVSLTDSVDQIMLVQKGMQQGNSNQDEMMKLIREQMDQVKKNLASLSDMAKTLEEWRISLNQSLEGIKNLQFQGNNIEQVVKKVEEISDEMEKKITQANQIKEMDFNRYRILKEVFHEISCLLYDQWNEHTEQYRILDNSKFTQKDYSQVGAEMTRKIQVHIDVMNYFISLVFKIKEIMESARE